MIQEVLDFRPDSVVKEYVIPIAGDKTYESIDNIEQLAQYDS